MYRAHFGRFRLLAVIGVFCLALIHGASAQARAYKTDTVTPGYETPQKAFNHPLAKEIAQIMTAANAPEEGSAGKFQEYFEKILYPTLTQNILIQTPLKDDKTPTTFVRIRLQVKQRFFNPASNEGALKLLNEVTMKKMLEYAYDNYHPSVRYNAMLFISEMLNASLLKTPPVRPYPEALPVLVKAAGDAKLPPAVRLAALVGVKRQADAGIKDEALKKPVVDAMMKLVGDTTPTPGISADALTWQRMRAAEVANVLGVNSPEVMTLIKPAMAAAPGAALPVVPGTPPGVPAPPGAEKSPFDN